MHVLHPGRATLAVGLGRVGRPVMAVHRLHVARAALATSRFGFPVLAVHAGDVVAGRLGQHGQQGRHYERPAAAGTRSFRCLFHR
jgi:hypothetical protein